MLKGKQDANVEETETEVQIAEKKSIGARIKGWFSKEDEVLKSQEDPLFADYEYADLGPESKAATQESNGSVSLTSGDDLGKSDIRKASSVLDRDLDRFLRDDALKRDQGPYTTLDGKQVGGFEIEKVVKSESSNLQQEASLQREKGIQDFDSSFDAEMARIGNEVKQEQQEDNAELEKMRAEFEKMAAMKKDESEDKFSASESEETKIDFSESNNEPEQESLQFGAVESDNPFMTDAFQSNESNSLETTSFTSEPEPSSDSSKTSFGEDDWAQQELGFDSKEDQFDKLDSQAWVSETEVKTSSGFNASNSGFDASTAESEGDWIESQPVTPNPAYQQESGQMIFDSKSVPSRFMSPDEKENWFRQTRLERAGKKNGVGTNEGLDVDGSESVIQMVSGVQESELPKVEKASSETVLSSSLPSTSNDVPEASSVKLGEPLWQTTGQTTEETVSSVEAAPQQVEQQEVPAFEIAAVIGPGLPKQVVNEKAETVQKTEETSAPAFGFEEISGLSSNEALPSIEWGDLPVQNEVMPEGSNESVVATLSSELPGRWFGIALSLGTICYLLIRRRSPQPTTKPAK
ncbi:MAG: hypothetical protein KDA65_05515 [Planctomycetaceae bacterium]|nr:hypothetical protein [Planctomycetaceae bacterium]